MPRPPSYPPSPKLTAPVARVAACGEHADRCRCVKPAGHNHAGDDADPVHECDPQCGAAWTGEAGAADFQVVRFPLPLGDVL
jgi:hypothetical protein